MNQSEFLTITAQSAGKFARTRCARFLSQSLSVAIAIALDSHLKAALKPVRNHISRETRQRVKYVGSRETRGTRDSIAEMRIDHEWFLILARKKRAR